MFFFTFFQASGLSRAMEMPSAKGNSIKPCGKKNAFFFLESCRKEERKKNPEANVARPRFFTLCSGKWKVVSKEFNRFPAQLFL